MAKKTKKKLHVTYNKKRFLAPDSLLSMAVIHTKIKPCGEAQIRISDCNNTIKIWNDLNDKNQLFEMILKTQNLINHLTEFNNELINRKG
jgi:hypothetical protein